MLSTPSAVPVNCPAKIIQIDCGAAHTAAVSGINAIISKFSLSLCAYISAHGYIPVTKSSLIFAMVLKSIMLILLALYFKGN